MGMLTSNKAGITSSRQRLTTSSHTSAHKRKAAGFCGCPYTTVNEDVSYLVLLALSRAMLWLMRFCCRLMPRCSALVR